MDAPCVHVYKVCIIVRPNKKISVFWVKGMKILGRLGRHIFFF